ncbi:MAG: putative metal-binding motif-containing protein, partial [Myxococcota bacterium]
MSLDPDHFGVVDARQSGFWCVAKTALASGDYGTPGGANDDCTQLDEDGDGYSVDSGDCDDADATISPGLADVWDGIDNDCDGTPDGGDIGDVAVGSVDGPASGYLGIHAGLGLGDVTGDGTPDFVVGGAVLNATQGAVYVLSGARPDGLSGGVSTSAVATVSGSTYAYFGATSPIAGDVTGDGVADLVVASGGAVTWGGGSTSVTLVSVFEGGPGLTGALTGADGDLVITGSSGTSATAYGNNRVLAHLDLNGDGLADIVYGQPNADSGRGEVAVFDAGALGGSVSLDDADTLLTGDSLQDGLGTGLGGADIDGDGYDDLFVGASGVDGEADGGGAWYQV